MGSRAKSGHETDILKSRCARNPQLGYPSALPAIGAMLGEVATTG